MPEDETLDDCGECDYVYYRLWLSDHVAVNRNGLRWLYDEDEAIIDF